MVVYKTINLLNGKWYIGKDVYNKPTYLGSGLAIKAAMAKYGRQNFRKEILEVCKDKQELSTREAHWIRITNAVNDPNSYNLTDGGQGGHVANHMNGRKLPLEWRNSLSRSHKKPVKVTILATGETLTFSSKNEGIAHFKVSRKRFCNNAVPGLFIEQYGITTF